MTTYERPWYKMNPTSTTGPDQRIWQFQGMLVRGIASRCNCLRWWLQDSYQDYLPRRVMLNVYAPGQVALKRVRKDNKSILSNIYQVNPRQNNRWLCVAHMSAVAMYWTSNWSLSSISNYVGANNNHLIWNWNSGTASRRCPYSYVTQKLSKAKTVYIFIHPRRE